MDGCHQNCAILPSAGQHWQPLTVHGEKDHIYWHLTHSGLWMLPRTLLFIFFRQYFWVAKQLAYKNTTLERDFDNLLDVTWWHVGPSIQKSFHLSQVAVLNLMWKTAKERHICSDKRCARKDIDRKSDLGINGLNATYFSVLNAIHVSYLIW